jgi:hypothetical protein
MTMVLVRTTLSLRLSAVVVEANIASRLVANWYSGAVFSAYAENWLKAYV